MRWTGRPPHSAGGASRRSSSVRSDYERDRVVVRVALPPPRELPLEPREPALELTGWQEGQGRDVLPAHPLQELRRRGLDAAMGRLGLDAPPPRLPACVLDCANRG